MEFFNVGYKKYFRTINLVMATFSFTACKIYFKINRVQAINDVNKLC